MEAHSCGPFPSDCIRSRVARRAHSDILTTFAYCPYPHLRMLCNPTIFEATPASKSAARTCRGQKASPWGRPGAQAHTASSRPPSACPADPRLDQPPPVRDTRSYNSGVSVPRARGAYTRAYAPRPLAQQTLVKPGHHLAA